MDKKGNLTLIFHYLRVFLYMIGIITLIPLIVLLFYPGEMPEAVNFIVPGTLMIFLGFIVTKFFQEKEKLKLSKNQNYQLVFLIWIFAILVSAIPFLMTGNYSFTQAIFESTSGYSTTGLSVVDVDNTYNIYLFHRSFMQLVGGVGLVLVVTSTFANKYGIYLYSSEGHSENLIPNLIKTSRLIITFYLSFIGLGTVLYVLFGMPTFDAINHAIAAVSTGGFSTHTQSIGGYNSIAIEIVTIFLMLLGSINFLVHLMLIKKQFKKVFNHSELRTFVVVAMIFSGLSIASLLNQYSVSDSIRLGIFQTISSITTTGFTVMDSFSGLPHAFIFGIVIMMLIGGSSGSTSGGIKQHRLSLMLHDIQWGLHSKLYDSRVIKSKVIYKFGNKVIVNNKEIKENYRFISIYILFWMVSSLTITFFGYNIMDSMFEVASALGTVGHSIGVMTYHSNPVVLWIGIIAMFLGRMEFYIIIIAIGKVFLDIKKTN
ncbi:MAG: potassium transporter TrkG [Acholeplasma sp.]